MSRNKKVIIIAVVAVLVIAAAVYFQSKSRRSNIRSDKQAVETVKTNVDFAKLPSKFPEDIPMENGAKITQNYNATTPDGKFQATRTFQTTQSLDANLALYTQFMQQNGWVVSTTVNEPATKMVYGEKYGKALTVAISENKLSQIKTVSITYNELE